jgi:galactokinase
MRTSCQSEPQPMARDVVDPTHRALRLFRKAFGGEPDALVRAPGRVNLIGEHTDYNEGFVLPAAIDRDLCIAIRVRSDGLVDVRSEGHEGHVIALDRFEDKTEGWGGYVQGVAWALAEAGHRPAGWDGAIASDIPVGAGLSSSAAIELATARAFATASGIEWDPTPIAKLCQRAENVWVGVACGLMDQLASARGRRDNAILLDCRSLELEWVPIPHRASIAILDTGTRRELQSSAYNERRRECEEAAAALGVRSLREVSAADLRSGSTETSSPVWRRARHVVTENDRTVAAAEAMRAGDAESMGRLMNESHASLRDDFAVSSEALDAIVEAARVADGCFGARLTGAGFAGCAVALVDRSAVADFERVISNAYAQATGRTCTVYLCRASDGASVLPRVSAEP